MVLFSFGQFGDGARQRSDPTSFRNTKSFDDRCTVSQHVRSRHPDYIPVILECGRKSPYIPEITNKKYLVPRAFLMSNFITMIRTRIKIPAHVGMFLFVNNTLVPVSASMDSLYHEHKDEDGFLYITYSGESVFG